MRSSKSRSRSKSNRTRPMGNVVNRVFDSSGPEGKVRGTPQQIIDKYLILARDAQLSNDRVATENFLQHAEHYTRMLSEAQREMQREQEQRRDTQPDNNQPRERNGRDRDDNDNRQPQDARDNGGVIDLNDDTDNGLVETPEARSAEVSEQQPAAEGKPARAPRRPRSPRKPRVAPDAAGGSDSAGNDAASGESDTASAAE